MSKWKYVEKDGNPENPGFYLCALIRPDWDNKECEPNFLRMFAFIDHRFFASAGDMFHRALAMTNEDTRGNYWCQSEGSYFGEQVFAWMEMEEPAMPELPEDAEWEEEE